MHDKFKKKHRTPQIDDRVRRQIAREAARRLYPLLAKEGRLGLTELSESEYYTAKRKAAAVLGHVVRPGDLPSDSEIREEVATMVRDRSEPEPSEISDDSAVPPPLRMADHLDRFAIYKMRLEPLASVKENPIWHPEGDALYHSLQVFEKAREVRPYDEEFLTAALLHDVGKAIDPKDHVTTGLRSLEGTLSSRVFWLIEHHMDLIARHNRPVDPKVRATVETSEYYEDLILLRQCDEAGREVGVTVGSIEDALDYLRGLEKEAYLES